MPLWVLTDKGKVVFQGLNFTPQHLATSGKLLLESNNLKLLCKKLYGNNVQL